MQRPRPLRLWLLRVRRLVVRRRLLPRRPHGRPRGGARRDGSQRGRRDYLPAAPPAPDAPGPRPSRLGPRRPGGAAATSAGRCPGVRRARAKPPTDAFPGRLRVRAADRVQRQADRQVARRDCALRSYSHANATDWNSTRLGWRSPSTRPPPLAPPGDGPGEGVDYFYARLGRLLALALLGRRRATTTCRWRATTRGARPARGARLQALPARLRAHPTRLPVLEPERRRRPPVDVPARRGACLAPSEINRSILVSHWGRTMLRPNNHTDVARARPALPRAHVRRLPLLRARQGRAAAHLQVAHFVQASPYATGKHVPRNVLNFRGNAHLNQPQYSLGCASSSTPSRRAPTGACAPTPAARATTAEREAQGRQGPDGCRSSAATRATTLATSSGASSAAAAGNGWGHIEEPVIHGCTVIIMPGIRVQMEGLLDMDKFSVRRARRAAHPRRDPARCRQGREHAGELAKVWERTPFACSRRSAGRTGCRTTRAGALRQAARDGRAEEPRLPDA